VGRGDENYIITCNCEESVPESKHTQIRGYYRLTFVLEFCPKLNSQRVLLSRV
jgi:hypothetical protein